MNCNTTHYRANSSSVPGDPTKTYQSYEQIVRLYLKPKLGHVKLAKLSPQMVQATMTSLATEPPPADAKSDKLLSARTVNHCRAVLRNALTQAQGEGLISRNPAEGRTIKLPQVDRAPTLYLSAEHAAMLIEKSLDHTIGPLITIALMTGLRVGEATGLTWDSIDLETGTIRVTQQLQRVEGKLTLKPLKSRSSRRTLSLPAEGVETLKALAGRHLLQKANTKNKLPYNTLGLAFTTTFGQPLDPKTVDKWLKALCVAAEIPSISFHVLRHTAASHLAAAGVPLTVVKDQLGHSAISLTANTYAHAVPAALKQASDTLGDVLRQAKQDRSR